MIIASWISYRTEL